MRSALQTARCVRRASAPTNESRPVRSHIRPSQRGRVPRHAVVGRERRAVDAAFHPHRRQRTCDVVHHEIVIRDTAAEVGHDRDMKIDTTILLPVTAVVASALLLMAGKKRIFEVIALIASVAWILLELDFFDWPIKKVSQGLVIGGTLLVTGVIVYLNTSNKREVTAATVLGILGGVLVVGALKISS
jgi:hypothetical protein